MKHASDLFWMPADDSRPAMHWKFDESYSVTKYEQFPGRDLPSLFDMAFEAREPLPVPQFGRAVPLGSDPREAIVEQPPLARSFLPFPDGFWSELYWNKRRMFLPGPVRTF
jgi:hypothetical protein